jgi:hypothetical protein
VETVLSQQTIGIAIAPSQLPLGMGNLVGQSYRNGMKELRKAMHEL